MKGEGFVILFDLMRKGITDKKESTILMWVLGKDKSFENSILELKRTDVGRIKPKIRAIIHKAGKKFPEELAKLN